MVKFQDNEGKIYDIHGDIFCTNCDKNIYVGQTGDTFYQRMLLNFSKIRTKRNKIMWQIIFVILWKIIKS